MNSIKKFPKNRKKSVPSKHLNLHFNRTFEKKTSLIVDFLSFIFLFIAEEEPECYDENSVQFDFRNPGTINGLPSMIEREKDDLTLVLKGWTAMRDYAGGYVRGDSGTALVEVTGLEPHRNYDFGVSVYCSDHCANHYLLILPDGNKIVPTMHETCCLNLQTNERLSCDVGIRGCTGASFDPVHTGVYMSDSAGKVVFGFEHNKSDSNPMVLLRLLHLLQHLKRLLIVPILIHSLTLMAIIVVNPDMKKTILQKMASSVMVRKFRLIVNVVWEINIIDARARLVKIIQVSHCKYLSLFIFKSRNFCIYRKTEIQT